MFDVGFAFADDLESDRWLSGRLGGRLRRGCLVGSYLGPKLVNKSVKPFVLRSHRVGLDFGPNASHQLAVTSNFGRD
ncbi:hypothetical protein V5E97_06630 [Singulisphaera sp. Ch08]|uniref:Uncharacterized protein n=1 Tax=Singulisphaera sp. Ch08 TaxID=3120278 RepID=A0AAU7CJR1_9BACT